MVLMNNQFRIGACYVATPAMPEQQQRLVIPIGRQGAKMQIAFVDSLEMADVGVGGFCDREYAKVMMYDGTYTFSSACEVSAGEYAKVREILGGEA